MAQRRHSARTGQRSQTSAAAAIIEATFPDVGRAYNELATALHRATAAPVVDEEQARQLWAATLWLEQDLEGLVRMVAIAVHQALGSWAAVGEVAGVSRQAAHKRWGGCYLPDPEDQARRLTRRP